MEPSQAVWCVVFLTSSFSFFIEGQAWACPQNSTHLFVTQIQQTVLRFDVELSSQSILQNYKILSPTKISLLSVVYSKGVVSGNWTVNNNFCTLTGSLADGKLYITLNNESQTGVYTLERLLNVEKCITVYLLGIPSTPSIFKDKDPLVGENVTITCHSTSTTTPAGHNLSLEYNWMVNGSFNPVDSKFTYSKFRQTVTITNVAKEDSGKQMTCTASEDVAYGYTSEGSNAVVISVLHGPDIVAFNPVNTSYEKEENFYLDVITCTAECNPACSFKWTKKETSEMISNTSTLKLGTLHKIDAGTYECHAIRPNSSDSKKTAELNVFVIYGPYKNSITLTPAQAKYTINESGFIHTLKCHADCWPSCTYTWTKQRDESTKIVSYSDVLELGQVNRSDAATYICSAENPSKATSDSTEVQLKVNYGPDPCEKLLSLYNYTEGDSVPDINCSSVCYPNCSYAWSRAGAIVSGSGILYLGKINRKQAGNYTFKANNTEPSYARLVERSFQVIVKYAPNVTIQFSSTNHLEGSSLTLFCKGEGVPATYIHTGLLQMVGQVVIPNNNTAKEGTAPYSSIYFSALRLQDTGKYICKMNNGIRDVNRIMDQVGSAEILVEVPPQVLKSNLIFAGAVGNSVTIQVPFYCYPNVTSVTVAMFDGREIKNSTKYSTLHVESIVNDTFYGAKVQLLGYLAILTISDLREEDFVNYTVTLKNRRGTTRVHVLVIAESIPSLPKSFVYILAFNKPKFVWEKGFNGGHLQTFVVQISVHNSDDWKTWIVATENDERYKINDTFYNADVTGLKPGTYTARLIANNSVGDAEPVKLNVTFTIMSTEVTPETSRQLVPAAAGGTVAALVVVIVIAVAVWRRRAGKNENEKNKLYDKKPHKRGKEKSSDEDTEVVNPMYVSAGPKSKKDEDVYVTPNKKQTPDPKFADVYAVVDKSKAANKKKKGKQTTPRLPPEGDVYENAPTKDEGGNAYGNATFEDSSYGTTDVSLRKKTKMENKDGLVYIDLAFSRQPKGKEKLVIIGLDERTPYAQVDFQKRADPLSHCDTEDPKNSSKK